MPEQGVNVFDSKAASSAAVSVSMDSVSLKTVAFLNITVKSVLDKAEIIGRPGQRK